MSVAKVMRDVCPTPLVLGRQVGNGWLVELFGEDDVGTVLNVNVVGVKPCQTVVPLGKNALRPKRAGQHPHQTDPNQYMPFHRGNLVINDSRNFL